MWSFAPCLPYAFLMSCLASHIVDSVVFLNPLTPEFNPSPQLCLSRFLMGILIFKVLTARRHFKSFCVKGLNKTITRFIHTVVLWVVVSCSLVGRHQCFGGIQCFCYQDEFSSRFHPFYRPRRHLGRAELCFLDLGTRRGWGVSVTPRPLSTSEKDPNPIVQEAGWAPGEVWNLVVYTQDLSLNLTKYKAWLTYRPQHKTLEHSTIFLGLQSVVVSHLGISQANNTACGKQFTGSVMALPARLFNKNKKKN
jgi:hypothetical protein